MSNASERDNPRINEVIRRAREAADLSQQVVAAAGRTTQSTYSRFETGEGNLDLDVILRIKEFIDKHPRKRTPLAALALDYPRHEVGTPLTKQITEELKHSAERKRRREEEEEDKQLIEDIKQLESLAERVPILEAENIALKAKIAELQKTIQELKERRPRRKGRK